MLRIVADLGNTRLKLGRVDETGQLEYVEAIHLDSEDILEDTLSRWIGDGHTGSQWAISTVNPPTAKRLEQLLQNRGVADVVWYRSAAAVPVPHAIVSPETAGADRALAVSAALGRRPSGRPGFVVLCGTAVVVERVSADGTWRGGAIAPGLALSARALHMLTAQLPLVSPSPSPPAWGNSTRPALEAGIFWGAVGTIRELLMRQASGFELPCWLIWTGGDAEALAPAIAWEGATVVPDLVLEGLARVAFGVAVGAAETGR